MSLLTMLQQVSDSIGLPRPSSIVSSTDQTVRSLLAIANEEGNALARRGSWNKLVKEATFATVNGTASYPLATIAPDFRHLLNDTSWNRSSRRSMGGPMSSQDWQAQQAWVAASPFQQFRIRGGSILITPTPTTAENIYFEYVSNSWCESSLGVDQTAWSADSDVGILDEYLMGLGVKFRWLKSKGFPAYMEAEQMYNSEVQKALGRDGGARTVSLNGRSSSRLRSQGLIPDTGYGV